MRGPVESGATDERGSLFIYKGMGRGIVLSQFKVRRKKNQQRNLPKWGTVKQCVWWSAERGGVTSKQRATCPLASGRATSLVVVALVLPRFKVRWKGKRNLKKNLSEHAATTSSSDSSNRCEQIGVKVGWHVTCEVDKARVSGRCIKSVGNGGWWKGWDEADKKVKPKKNSSMCYGQTLQGGGHEVRKQWGQWWMLAVYSEDGIKPKKIECWWRGNVLLSSAD